MSVIVLFSGSFCHGDEVGRVLSEKTGYELLDDQTLIRDTARRFNIDEGKVAKALMGKASIFNKFTHEKERCLAGLKVVLGDALQKDNLLFYGYSGLMVGGDIPHVLRVCLIADLKYRAALGAKEESVLEKEAVRRLHKEDENRVLWVEYLFNCRDPWSPDLYDMVIPMDKIPVDGAVELVLFNLAKDVLKVTPASKQAVEDFRLAAQVDLKLAQAGHNVSVSAREGRVTLAINKQVLMLSSLEEELRRLVQPIPGVQGVETKVGPGYYQTDIYRRFDFDVPLPSKVLLVDDEREFAQTLSERLQMREMGSAVVYGGEEALSVLEEEEPEVMVLDLKMPGVDGLEVLRRVKKEHPNVEVIILTGHGSDEVQKECMEMGACAYLEKPVNIDKLTQSMQDAYRKIKERKAGQDKD